MKFILPLFLLLFPLTQDFEYVLHAVTSNACTIKVANINCKKDCENKAVLFCDTTALLSDGSYVGTLELPTKVLKDKDAGTIVKVLTDRDTYQFTHKHNGVTDQEGDAACFNPTVALLFVDRDSVVFAQMIMDVDCRQYLLYYLVNGQYVRVSGVGQRDITFYGQSGSKMLEVFNRYGLNCLMRNY